MQALTQPQREELRYALREQIVIASTVALNAEMLQRRLERARALNFTPSIDDVSAAASFLVSLGHVKAIAAPLGATLFYQATAEGVLAHERGQ